MTDFGSGALYRIYEFSAGGASRSFPARANVLSGTIELGEVYPTTNRTLNFRLFTRDNQAVGGGADHDGVRLTVFDTGSAFSVTAPAAGAAWPAGLQRSVQWNIAGTTVVPIACSRVDILFSSDGGVTFPTLLANDTPNDGTELVTTPATPTDNAAASSCSVPTISSTTFRQPLACVLIAVAGPWLGQCAAQKTGRLRAHW